MVDSVSEKSLKRLPEKATYILRRHESESTPGDFYIMPDDGDVPWEVDLLQVYNLLHNVHTSRNATASLHMLGMVYESKDKNKPYVTYGAAAVPKSTKHTFIVSTYLDLHGVEALRNSISEHDKIHSPTEGSRILIELAEAATVASQSPYTSWVRGRLYQSNQDAKEDRSDNSLHYFAVREAMKSFMKKEVPIQYDDLSFDTTNRTPVLLDRERLAGAFPEGAVAEIYDFMTRIKHPVTGEQQYAYCAVIYDRNSNRSSVLVKQLHDYDSLEVSADYAITDMLRD